MKARGHQEPIADGSSERFSKLPKLLTLGKTGRQEMEGPSISGKLSEESRLPDATKTGEKVGLKV